MAENMKQVASDAARDEVSRFSRSALDYDWPHEEGSVRPRELLEWVIHQREAQTRRRKYLGAIVLAFASAGASVAIPAAWSWLANFLSR